MAEQSIQAIYTEKIGEDKRSHQIYQSEVNLVGYDAKAVVAPRTQESKLSRSETASQFSDGSSTAMIKTTNIDMTTYMLTPNDTRDPSYNNLTLTYVVCRQRYREARRKQRAQFVKEMETHELLQSKALDGVRIHREFCNVILSKIHPEEVIKLTQKQKDRIEEILARPVEQ